REGRRAGGELYQSAIRFVRAAIRPLRSLGKRSTTTVFEPAKFSTGDILVLLDWVWIDSAYGSALCALRRSNGVKISPLVYDLLPWRFPQFFSVGFGDIFTARLAELLA